MVTDLYPEISVIRMQADSPTGGCTGGTPLRALFSQHVKVHSGAMSPLGGRAGGQARMAYRFKKGLRINFWIIHPYLYQKHPPNRLQKL